VIRTEQGPVFTTPIRDALGDIPAVDLAAAYGIPVAGAGDEIAVAALTLRARGSLRARDIGQSLAALPAGQRPRIVHVVERIPVTTWFRPMTQKLREAGIPEPGEGAQAWYLDASGETYRPLSVAARRRITGSPKRAASRPSTA